MNNLIDMNKVKRGLFVILVILPFLKGYAQSDMIGYGLHKTLPQANNLNPAFLPDYKFTLALPGLAGFKMNASQNFTNLELLTATNADSTFDISGFYDKLRNNNRVTGNVNVPILNLGFRSAVGYTAFTINLRTFNRISFPKALVDLIYLGNTGENSDLNFDKLAFKSNTFSEIGLSHGREILGGKMTVGARIKYLIGHSYTDISDFNLSLRTFEDSIRLSTAGFTARTAGIAGYAALDDGNGDEIDAVLNARGFGLDLGATYQFSSKIQFFGSINDLGYISWKDYNKNFVAPATSVTFTGADFLDDSFEDELDSTLNSLDNRIVEEKASQFSTSLTANIYLGGSYQISRRQKALAIFYSELYKGTLVPAFSGMYNFQYNAFFNFAAGATLMNGRVNNISTGFTLKLVPFQLCVATNDLLSIVNPIKGRAADIRFGINLTFGDINKSKRKGKKNSSNTIDTIDLGVD